jgi:NADH-quinone oxidoreductase subunit H
MRYDQFMNLGWKILIPGSLIWILMVATVRTLQDHANDRGPWLTVAAIIAAIALVILLIDPGAKKRRESEDKAEQDRVANAPSLDNIPWPPRTQEQRSVLTSAGSGRPTSPPPSSPPSSPPGQDSPPPGISKRT